MPIGDLPPPPTHPEDPPLVSICVNVEWIPYLIGMVYPARYPEYWAGTLEENRVARKDVINLINLMQNASEDGCMNTCCVQPYIIKRIDPTTGTVQISTDNGGSWSPAPGGFIPQIVKPVPPVTSGVSATKCDAAQNCMDQINDWITHVTNDFDTAVDIFAFGSAVIAAIADAVLLILSAGTLTLIEAEIITAIGAAITGVWLAGKTVFSNYWTSDVKSKIKCAFYHHIGDDGSFTDAQFSGVWNEINSELPGALAKMLLVGFLSSIGQPGLNAMAASGKNTGANCDECSDICPIEWTFFGVHDVVQDPDNHNIYNATTDGGGAHVAFTSGDMSQGCYFAGPLGEHSYWPIGSASPVGGTNPALTAIWNADLGGPADSTPITFTFSKFPIT